MRSTGAGTRFVSDEYSFIVGPASLAEPIDSQNVYDELAEYSTAEVLTNLLAIPDVRQIGEAGAHWRGWAAAWESGDRLIFFEDVEELGDWNHFGGLSLRCDCRLGDVLDLWEALRVRYSGLWLIDSNTWLQTPMSFAARITFEPSWRTTDVIALARGIRTEGAFDRFPILADALQDAGCDDDEFLDHCRRLGSYVRGYWLVDLVLGDT